MNILFLGEIVGRCGIGTIKNGLKKLRAARNIDFVIANGESATSGFGLGYTNAQSMFHMGIDVFTLGEKSFFKMDMVQGIARDDRILRPLNYPEGVPGRGMRFYNVGSSRICIINVLGMMGFTNPHLANPFLNARNLASKALEQTPYVFYVIHAQATAEKCAMGYLLDGHVSAVIGTHCKVLTSDACILPHGTAYISDTGRCGAFISVGGFTPEGEIKKIRTQFPVRSTESWECPELQGLLVSLDNSGMPVKVEVIKEEVEVPCLQ